MLFHLAFSRGSIRGSLMKCYFGLVSIVIPQVGGLEISCFNLLLVTITSSALFELMAVGLDCNIRY